MTINLSYTVLIVKDYWNMTWETVVNSMDDTVEITHLFNRDATRRLTFVGRASELEGWCEKEELEFVKLIRREEVDIPQWC